MITVACCCRWLGLFLLGSGVLVAQQAGRNPSSDPQPGAAPRVVVPTQLQRQPNPAGYGSSSQPYRPRIIYPWKKFITCTVFWIGEQPSGRNKTPNHASSWDRSWAENYGGYDDPDPANRIADFRSGEFRPKAFIPKLNPFYVALPYNDVLNHLSHKPEASRVIPWFSRVKPMPGDTVCKGRWLQIHRNGRTCYAQWEDCGPWITDDWEYVFGDRPPKNAENGQAAIDFSPAVRDYLGIQSGQKVHWRFIEASDVPYGPWKKYGQSLQPGIPAATHSAGVSGGMAPPPVGSDPETERRYMEQLRRLRDEEFLKRPLRSDLR